MTFDPTDRGALVATAHAAVSAANGTTDRLAALGYARGDAMVLAIASLVEAAVVVAYRIASTEADRRGLLDLIRNQINHTPLSDNPDWQIGPPS